MAKCEKCHDIGYINDEYSGTIICDCTFKKAGFGRMVRTDYPASKSDKTYLGDGVYADIENGQVRLWTDNGMTVSNVIYMELDVLKTLVEYLEKKGLL